MKSTTLNVNSWHYKLASWFGYDPDFKDHDICAYLRRVMLGMVIVPIAAAAAIILTIAVSIILVHMVLGPWFFFMYGIPFNEFATVGWVILLAAGTLFGFFFGMDRFKRYLHNKRNEARNSPEQEPGFLKLAYRSYKDKFCMKLQFVDKDGKPYETESQKWVREQNELHAAQLAAVIAEETKATDDGKPGTNDTAP